MTNLLYITSNGRSGSGKSAALLGTMQLLLKNIRKVAFFRPIIETSADDEKDHDIELLLTHFGIEQEYDEAYAMTLYEARSLINSGKRATIIESVISKLKKLESKYEFILCEGLDASGQDGSFELELSADLADALSCPVLVLTNGEDKNQQQVIDSSQAIFDFFEERSANIVSCIVHTSSLTSEEEAAVKSILKTGEHSSDPLQTYFLPAEEALAKPTMGDVQRWTNAVILYGEDRLENLVKDYLIAAMQADHFLHHIKQGNLIITPGDRVDILISCIMSRLSETFQNISGVVLTGGFNISPMVKRLMDGFPTIPFPILAMEGNTSKSMNILSKLYGDIHTGDTRKINTAIGLFEEKVDTHKLASTAINTKSKKISPKMFEYSLMEMASAHKMRIVLPEGEESRILLATDTLLRRKVADLVLLGNPTKVRQKINELGLDFEVPIIDPEKSEYFEDFANTYYELRKAKGVSLEIARDTMRDPAYFGTMMLYKDYVDGVVSGSITTTAHTIRPAFEFIKTRPDIPIVSSVILLCLKDRVLVFGDCAVNPNPTADQLASIAINSAKTAKVFGIEPRVAMLSYSTGSSGKGEDVDAVKEATRIAKERAPEILLEGPLQYDAAIDANVAQIKMPGSQVAGQATVFIFPDLSAGNNTYKAVQRAADAIAIGPLLQGLNKPVNDLSRGCTVPDIVNTVAITALQAQEMKGFIK